MQPRAAAGMRGLEAAGPGLAFCQGLGCSPRAPSVPRCWTCGARHDPGPAWAAVLSNVRGRSPLPSSSLPRSGVSWGSASC